MSEGPRRADDRASTAPQDPGRRAGLRVRVASYNIHRCVGSDGRCDPARVARVLQRARLRSRRPAGSRQQPGPSADVAAARIPGAAPPAWTRWPACASCVTWATTGTRCSRGTASSACAATISASRGASRAARSTSSSTSHGVAAACHRHAPRAHAGRAAAPDARASSARGARRRPRMPLVLLGDINEWLPLGRPLRWLHACFGRPPSARSFPALWPLLALDRIWARPRDSLLTVRAHRSAAARLASDHLPVTAELKLATLHGSPRTTDHVAPAGSAA